VIFRKICFGSRSTEGAHAFAVNLSLLTTATRQNTNPIELFKHIILNTDQTPLEMLYDQNAFDTS